MWIRDGKIRIRDGKNWIRDKHPGSATLRRTMNRVAGIRMHQNYFGKLNPDPNQSHNSGAQKESRRAVDAHNGGVEAQKWSL